MRLRSLIALAALCLAAPALAQTKIVLGQVSRTTTNWPFYVADAKGFFKPENLAIQYEYIGNVSNLGQQIVGGSLDVGVTTFEVNLQLGELGAPISMIGATAIKYAYSMKIGRAHV